jgi:hypothetical protein
MKNIIDNVEHEPLKIERDYPSKKQEKSYPLRYDNYVFEKFNEMNTTEMLNDYNKWKNGINYKTNRKITINGKIHRELKQKFIINYRFSSSSVLFEYLTNINTQEYLQETEKIKTKVNLENAVIKNYNNMVDSIIEKIQKLEKWNSFIEFEGKKYGIPNNINNIHRENNCFGLIKEDYYESCNCHCCEDWGGCNNPIGTQYYTCEKCNYKYSISTNYSKNYKGK